MREDLLELLRSPLSLLLLTLAGYRLGLWLKHVTGAHPLAQPVIPAVALTGAGITLLDVDYAAYADAATLVSFWLGPATVALALPLYRQWSRVRAVLAPMLVALPIGAVVSIATAYGLVHLLGGSEELAATMAPKAATTPVSIALSETIGGVPALTAVVTVTAGILGAVLAPTLMTWARITDRRARGLAMGASSHGVGTSRSLSDDETEGAFSGLAMGLTALLTSVLIPVVLLVR
ncbi:LrgB family protein [Nocardioides yefusunii]|uniref:LrgB family protein n=1 Tax=Nocardioides yefusunii TaxID=2500546 RepID=A0ABW1R0B3_9ACTN|nr:LrgB family protein [Nocardioides yefusunii]